MSSSISRRDFGRIAVLTGGLLAATTGAAGGHRLVEGGGGLDHRPQPGPEVARRLGLHAGPVPVRHLPRLPAPAHAYPRTSDGAMWHSTSFTQQRWCDAAVHRAVRPAVQRQTYCFQDAYHNLTTYFGHLTSSTGLLFHAYSTDGICPGTGVTGSLSGYYGRPRTTNDRHGLARSSS